MKNFNWVLPATLIFGVLCLIAIVMGVTGCMQVIVEKPDETKIKVNTLFYKLDMDTLITDSVTIENYTGDPGKTELYTPYGVIKHE
jgi:hypothetical protein